MKLRSRRLPKGNLILLKILKLLRADYFCSSLKFCLLGQTLANQIPAVKGKTRIPYLKLNLIGLNFSGQITSSIQILSELETFSQCLD